MRSKTKEIKAGAKTLAGITPNGALLGTMPSTLVRVEYCSKKSGKPDDISSGKHSISEDSHKKRAGTTCIGEKRVWNKREKRKDE